MEKKFSSDESVDKGMMAIVMGTLFRNKNVSSKEQSRELKSHYRKFYFRQKLKTDKKSAAAFTPFLGPNILKIVNEKDRGALIA